MDLDHYNVCTPDIHQLIYQRIYTDELESLTKENFRYNNIYFMFSPEVSDESDASHSFGKSMNSARQKGGHLF